MTNMFSPTSFSHSSHICSNFQLTFLKVTKKKPHNFLVLEEKDKLFRESGDKISFTYYFIQLQLDH